MNLFTRNNLYYHLLKYIFTIPPETTCISCSTHKTQPINSIQRSPSWETKMSSVSHEIPRILWKPAVHYRIHKSLPPVQILCHINTVHAPKPTSWRSILLLSSHLNIGLASDISPSLLPSKSLYALILSSIRATWPAQLILLDFIKRIIFGEYRSNNSLSFRLINNNSYYFPQQHLPTGFVMQAHCVLCEVRTEYSYTI